MESSKASIVCEKVGETMPDVAGVGILVGFAAQAFLTLALAIWVVLLSKRGRMAAQHEEGTVDHELDVKRAQVVSEILMVGNGIQMALGTALVITALSHGQGLDLYHMHLIYDTASFVGISNCAAVVCWNYVKTRFTPNEHQPSKRFRFAHYTEHRGTWLYAVLLLAFTVFFAIQLNEWDLESEELGHCFITSWTSAPGASQPATTKSYVAITAGWLLLTMFGTVFCAGRWRRTLLALSVLQFPLHLYVATALKLNNQAHLDGEESENGWDFGQTTALVLLIGTLIELVRRIFKYREFEKEVKIRVAHARLKPRANPLAQMALLASREQEDVETGGRQR
ncbi:hypothetical protein GQ53DRAFT_850177 [Thozetella sp. PMI_491]|nr:hypothetical protein GQ53DRAFT_850177 [Thozetella sp. PMI_491]